VRTLPACAGSRARPLYPAPVLPALDHRCGCFTLGGMLSKEGGRAPLVRANARKSMRQTRRLIYFASLVLLAAPLAGQVVLSPNPSRVLGHPQPTLVTANPNYVEGKELYSPSGIAVDPSGPSPIVYVADTRQPPVYGSGETPRASRKGPPPTSPSVNRTTFHRATTTPAHFRPVGSTVPGAGGERERRPLCRRTR
jgi:hypothetical protein